MPESKCTTCNTQLYAETDESLKRLELQHHRDSAQEVNFISSLGTRKTIKHFCVVFKIVDEEGNRNIRAYAHGI